MILEFRSTGSLAVTIGVEGLALLSAVSKMQLLKMLYHTFLSK